VNWVAQQNTTKTTKHHKTPQNTTKHHPKMNKIPPQNEQNSTPLLKDNKKGNFLTFACSPSITNSDNRAQTMMTD
jgi:hypothetical protein